MVSRAAAPRWHQAPPRQWDSCAAHLDTPIMNSEFLNLQVPSGSYHSPVRLILASASPRRAELLRAAGYAFEPVAVDIDERARPGEAPEVYVRRLAMEKSARATGVVSRFSRTDGAPTGGHAAGEIVVAADTAVIVGGVILGKPGSDDEGRRMLELLSGREHRVLTGISVRSGSVELGGVESTAVWFAPLSRADIE